MDKGNLHTVYLGLGSNLGDKEDNIRRAIKLIGKNIGEVKTISSFYITEPEGFISKNTFINAACLVSSPLSPLEVLRQILDIEKQMGRTSKSYNKIYADRIIDIDILLYDSEVLEFTNLILPHPDLHKRTFVLYPLAEIAGNIIHPVFNRSIENLKDELKTGLSK